MVTVQGLVMPVQAPPHPTKLELLAASAVKVTGMPDGEELIVPVPVPILVTASGTGEADPPVPPPSLDALTAHMVVMFSVTCSALLMMDCDSKIAGAAPEGSVTTRLARIWSAVGV